MGLKNNTHILFKKGYSCSESVIRGAYESKILDQNLDIKILNQVASSFSAGMGESGCICGAVASAQMVLGLTFGRKDLSVSPKEMKIISKTFIDKFKAKRKATCCKVLSAGFDFHSPERRNNCAEIVQEVTDLLEEHIQEYLKQVETV